MIYILFKFFRVVLYVRVFRWHLGFPNSQGVTVGIRAGFRSVVIKLLKWHTVHSRWGWEIHCFRIAIVMFHLLSNCWIASVLSFLVVSLWYDVISYTYEIILRLLRWYSLFIVDYWLWVLLRGWGCSCGPGLCQVTPLFVVKIGRASCRERV